MSTAFEIGLQLHDFWNMEMWELRACAKGYKNRVEQENRFTASMFCMLANHWRDSKAGALTLEKIGMGTEEKTESNRVTKEELEQMQDDFDNSPGGIVMTPKMENFFKKV